MTTAQRPDEATVMAYVDGELDEAGIAQVERAMTTDADLARHVRLLQDTTTALRAAFNAPLHEPVPERLLAPLGAQSGRWRPHSVRRYLAMAAALALAVFGGVGLYANTSYELPFTIQAMAQGNWLNGITNYHNVYIRTAARDERLLVDVNADDVGYLEEWFGKRLKRDVRLPRLDSQGYQIQGGRVTFVEGQPAAQFFYKAMSGDAIVSLTIAQTRRKDAEWTAVKHNGLHVIYWRKNGYSYVFAGAVDKVVLHRFAAMVPDEIERI